jgi:hypothetical protein
MGRALRETHQPRVLVVMGFAKSSTHPTACFVDGPFGNRIELLQPKALQQHS